MGEHERNSPQGPRLRPAVPRHGYSLAYDMAGEGGPMASGSRAGMPGNSNGHRRSKALSWQDRHPQYSRFIVALGSLGIAATAVIVVIKTVAGG